jgi:hypothetical protein
MENKGGNGVPVTTVRITPYQEALGETPVCGVTINLRHCDKPVRTTPSSGLGVQTRTADRQARCGTIVINGSLPVRAARQANFVCLKSEHF